MIHQHPTFPTRQQITEWDSEYFDEDQNFDFMMIKAFQAGADRQLEQVIDWVKSHLDTGNLIYEWGEPISESIKKAMRPQQQEDKQP